ncbi:MAG TPA: mitochondrial fission ELM1 family protein [Rudaea sp.]|nr:mitochondrial fission ELM1 family protein [Rudaea sp.]
MDPLIADASSAAWAIADGAAGNERQALALAQALAKQTQMLRIELRPPWSWFAPRLTSAASLAFPANVRRKMRAPWPPLAVGCGRASALVTRCLRHAGAGRTFTVQILDPRVDPANFDVVVAPRHDALQGENVIQTLGSLNCVNDTWLADGLTQFPRLAHLPQPRTAVLLGGPRRGLGLDETWLDKLLAHIAAITARDGGSVMITCSRRTPDSWRARVRGTLASGCLHYWIDERDGINPYQGYLAAADRIVVTPDSVNMLSEACATGKPVLTLLPTGASGKLVRFTATLVSERRVHTLEHNMDISTIAPVAPLRELDEVAGKIRLRMQAREPAQTGEN